MDATASGPLVAARDRAAVLDHRIELLAARGQQRGPLDYLPSVPVRALMDPEWGDYVAARENLVRDLADRVRESASDAAPAWASGMNVPPGLIEELTVWRAAFSIPDTDRRPTGPPRGRPMESRW